MQKKAENSNQITQKVWNAFADTYTIFDRCMQTFYYTLVNMMDITQAKHILEIACGTGKLLPYTMNLKPLDCSYLASDISNKMVDLAKLGLKDYLQKVGSLAKLEDWMKKNNLTISVIDGQNTFQSEYKFDRIICNLVLMHTENDKKMMESLHTMAQEGCLLGVTVWGDKSKANFLTLYNQARQSLGKPNQNPKDKHYLYNKIEQLGNKTGWEVLVEWQQNAPFNYFSIDETLKFLIADFGSGDKEVIAYVQNKVRQTFSENKTLNFPVQMAILRKK